MLLEPTRHGNLRCAQRGISPTAINAAVDWGLKRKVGDGCTAYFVGRRSVARAARHGVSLKRHLGVTVIVEGGRRIVTAYVSAKPPIDGGKRAHSRCSRRRV